MAPSRRKPKGEKVDQKVKIVTRKERRKKERETKKYRKAAYNSRLGAKPQVPIPTEEDHTICSQNASPPTKKVTVTRKNSGQRRPLSVAEERDKKEIGQLEKLLNIKGKSKLPKSFSEDGLDYVLGAVGSYNDPIRHGVSPEQEENEDETEMMEAEDVDEPMGEEEEEGEDLEEVLEEEEEELEEEEEELEEDLEEVLEEEEEEEKEEDLEEVLEEEEEEEEEEVSEESCNSDSDEEYQVDEEELQNMESNKLKRKRCVLTYLPDAPTPQYGTTYGLVEGGIIRSCDKKKKKKEAGSCSSSRIPHRVSFHLPDEGERMAEVEGMAEVEADKNGVSAAVAKYVPQHQEDRTDSQRLTRRVQGLMNRLSERNMKSISTDMEGLYRESSRNDMNSAVWSVLEKLCSGLVPMSERFAMEQAMLVAILHHHVGTEVGAYMAQCLAVGLAKELDGEPAASGKKAEYILLLLAHLYNYKVVHCVLVYDIIRRLVTIFSERNVELLLLLLKNAGMEIRRDDPGSLKAVILQIQSAAASSDLSTTPRVKFMLEILSALKTNNSRKIPNYDPSVLEHMKKLLRSLLRSSGTLEEAQVKVSLEDLVNADKQGRWWVVGSAWTGRSSGASQTEGVSSAGLAGTGTGLREGSEEVWILEMARQQRMNTDLRKTLFGVIMTSEDYVDCFQKLLKLKLSDVQEREIVHVLLDCCLQEKQFNPYYAHLAQKLCEFKRSYQITFQYSLWDRFKALDSLTAVNLTNLRQLVFHLITKKALSLSILKVVEFTELGKKEVDFYKTLFQTLLTEPSESVVVQVFSRISPFPNLKKLRDSLLIFLNQYLGSKETSKETSKGNSFLEQRLRLIEQSLGTLSHLF